MLVGINFLYLQKSEGAERCKINDIVGCADRRMNKLLHLPILTTLILSLPSLMLF